VVEDFIAGKNEEDYATGGCIIFSPDVFGWFGGMASRGSAYRELRLLFPVYPMYSYND
jgi:hypothetical protein